MEIRVKLITFLTICIFCGFSFSEITNKIVAKVGSEIITLNDLKEASGSTTDKEFQEKILQKLIDRALLLGLAKSSGIKVSEEAVKKEAARRLNEVKSRFSDESEFRNWLEAQGLTLEDVESRLINRIKQDFAIELLLRRNTKPIEPEEIQSFLEKNPEIEQVRIRLIFLSFSSLTSNKEKELVKELAYSIVARLRAGEDFGYLVEQYSEDTYTKLQKGDLGYVSRGDILPEIERAAFSLKLKEISDPIITEKGYYIIQVLEKRDVFDYLFEQRLEETRARLIQELREKVSVEINL